MCLSCVISILSADWSLIGWYTSILFFYFDLLLFSVFDFSHETLVYCCQFHPKKIMFIHGLFKEFVPRNLYIDHEVYSENFWKHKVMRLAYHWIKINVYIPGCLDIKADLNICRKWDFVSEIITIFSSIVLPYLFYVSTGCYYKCELWGGLTTLIQDINTFCNAPSFWSSLV